MQAETTGEPGPPVGPKPMPFGKTFRSLGHRDYRLYFFGQLVSLTGTWMQVAALAWLAFDLTGREAWPAYVLAAHMIPAFLFGTVGGWLADHFPKRRIIAVCQGGFMAVGFILTALTLGGWVEPWHLIVLMACQGVMMAADLPARLSFVPLLVPREDLINAVALNSVLFNSARLLGPTAAGLVMLAGGPGTCFLINSLSYVPILLSLRAIRVAEAREPARAGEGGFWAALTGGAAALARQPRLAAVVLLAAAVALIGWPLQSLLPAFAARVLHASESTFSMLMSAVGLGALVAALAVARFGRTERQRQFLLAGVAVIAASLHGLASSTTTWLAVGCCGGFGFGMILFFPTGQSMVQLRAEDRYRGRVMAMWGLAIAAAVPTGNLILGPLAERLGVAAVIRGQAVAATALTAAGLTLVVAGVIRRRPRQAAGTLTGPAQRLD